MTASSTPTTLPEVAFYYPNPYWRNPDWAKNLILFFDGIGMLIPNYMEHHSDLDDMAVIAGLKEHALFHVIEPETAVDKGATKTLANSLVDIIVSDRLDHLRKDEGTHFHTLSRSRLGYSGDPELAEFVFQELKERGLAKDSEDGLSIPMHPTVRSLILVLLAQILRPQGRERGLDLSPATDRSELVGALTEMLSAPSGPTASDVVSFDMATVGVDLGSVDIAEILAFRREHYSDHRNYSLSVRQFARDLSLMPKDERKKAFEARQEELDDLASKLRKLARGAWNKPASFAISLSGAAWTYATGDPIGAAIAAGGSMLGLGGGESIEVGAYSYLFNAHTKYA
ncbi:MAG: hypothetical protein R3C01_13265 [Planctomycetaceae bacterium]